MNRIILLLIAFLMTFQQGLLAQQEQARVITLQEAIEIALENNFSLKQAGNDLELAEKRIISEYADFLPDMSARIGGNRNVGQQFVADRLSQGLNPFVSITQQSVSGNFSANVPIFNGFENIYSLRASEASKLSSEEALQRQRETVIFNTASAYLQVLLDIQLLEIRKENLVTSEKVLEQTQAQVEVGSRPIVDQYQQESTVANNELLVTQQDNAYLLDRLALIRQLQLDPLAEYEFVVPELKDDELLRNTTNLDLRQLVEAALLNRSDLRSTQADIRNLELQNQIAKAALFPTISASFGISSRYSDQFGFGGNIVSFNDQFFDQQVNRSLGFSVNVPIFSNWNRIFNIQQTQVQLKNAELNLENTELQVIQEVTQAFNDYNSFVKQFQSAQKSLRANEKAFETQQERYNIGASTLIELSQAQAQYVQSQAEYTQAKFQLVFQEKLLDFFLGKLSGSEIEF